MSAPNPKDSPRSPHRVTLRYDDALHELLEQNRQPDEEMAACIRRLLRANLTADMNTVKTTVERSSTRAEQQLLRFEQQMLTVVGSLAKRVGDLDESMQEVRSLIGNYTGTFKEFADALSDNQKAFLSQTKR